MLTQEDLSSVGLTDQYALAFEAMLFAGDLNPTNIYWVSESLKAGALPQVVKNYIEHLEMHLPKLLPRKVVI